MQWVSKNRDFQPISLYLRNDIDLERSLTPIPLFDAEQLRNGTRYIHRFKNDVLIGRDLYALLKGVISNDLE